MTKAAEWSVRVKQWRASGRSAREYCRGKDFTAATLLWWSSRLRRAGAGPGAATAPVRLARVVRLAERDDGARTAPIVVHVGGARVEVSAGADAAALAAVMDALGARRGGAR